jgi:hypothetical protein
MANAALKAQSVLLFEAARRRKPSFKVKRLCSLVEHAMCLKQKSLLQCSRKALNRHIAEHLSSTAR